MYYNECPLCGANLDPGEPCDCQEEKKSKKKLQLKNQREHRNRAYLKSQKKIRCLMENVLKCIW